MYVCMYVCMYVYTTLEMIKKNKKKVFIWLFLFKGLFLVVSKVHAYEIKWKGF